MFAGVWIDIAFLLEKRPLLVECSLWTSRIVGVIAGLVAAYNGKLFVIAKIESGNRPSTEIGIRRGGVVSGNNFVGGDDAGAARLVGRVVSLFAA